MLLPHVGAPWKSLPWEGWGRFVWNRRKTSICQNVLFKNLTSSYPLEVCVVPVLLTLVLVAAIHNCCLLLGSGREWAVTRCL